MPLKGKTVRNAISLGLHCPDEKLKEVFLDFKQYFLDTLQKDNQLYDPV